MVTKKIQSILKTNDRISFFDKLLLKSAGVSIDLMEKCPRFEVIKYSSIGVTIIFTAILATASSYFAFSLIFSNQTVAFALSLFWGAIIFNLDRFIVATMRVSDNRLKEFFKAAPRFMLAVIIALVISKPLEIKLFENEINTYLLEEQTAKLADINLAYDQKLAQIVEGRSTINSAYNERLMLREKYYQDYICECDGTCGTLKRGRGPECSAKQQKYLDILAELELDRRDSDVLIERLNDREKILAQERSKETDRVISVNKSGFFGKVQALNSIDKFSSTFIFLIFILIETAPIITKLISNKGPYENMILEQEKVYEIEYLKSVESLNQERLKNKKINEMNTEQEIKHKEAEILSKAKIEALERYEALRRELYKKSKKN